MNARQPLSQVGSHRAMQAEHIGALVGTKSLKQLTFQQLLDLQDEASEDDSFDTFNDVSRKLKDRRAIAKAALVKLFVSQIEGNGGMIPLLIGKTLAHRRIDDYLREVLGTESGTADAVTMVLHATGRFEVIAARAAEYANEQCEDLLRAGWSE